MHSEHASVVIALSTFNDTERTIRAVQSALGCSKLLQPRVVAVDDGSEPQTVLALRRIALDEPRFTLVEAEHRERGWARFDAIQVALKLNPDFLLFIDADMQLASGALEQCISLCADTGAGAIVIQETPISDHRNFATRVKVFEREVVNSTEQPITDDSIEAARFWSVEAYRVSGGLSPHQTAFEEIQPTIRYRRLGGLVARLGGRWLLHDEKHVRFRELLMKKSGYFAAMDKTTASEKGGVWEAARRWYPFRRVYYEPQNLRRYVDKPALAAGMLTMYGALTVSAVANLGWAGLSRAMAADREDADRE